MSEYWKSTPKYWCKHCKTYVRDTKLERQQHEATARHQGNIQRSLRDLHRDQERQEREKQRAKDEVARLNSVVSGNAGSSSSSDDPPWRKKPIFSKSSVPQQASTEERKRQVAQLAELGVAIPEEYRREMAMAGDWQVVSERPLSPDVKEDGEEDTKLEALNTGVRKRKLGDDELELEEGKAPKKAWGSAFKTYSGLKDADIDIESLLKKPASKTKDKTSVKTEPAIKHSESEDEAVVMQQLPEAESNIPKTVPNEAPQPEGYRIKTEDSDTQAKEHAPTPTVVFKKRKAKVPR